MKAFVDTNVLVYAYDRAAGARHERARRLVEELWHNETGVLSTQVPALPSRGKPPER